MEKVIFKDISRIPDNWEIKKYLIILKNLKPILKRQFNVSQIGIFGSYVRNTQREDSDIDIVVRFASPIGLEFFDLVEFLEKRLGKKIDLVSYNAISPYIKPYIEKEIIWI